MSRITYAVLSVLIIICCPVPAEAAPMEVLTLEEALELAWQHNPRMTGARKGIEAARGEYTNTRRWPDPSLEFEIGGLKSSEDGSRQAHLDAVSFKQPLDPLGTRRLQADIGANGITIEEQGLKRIWSEVYVTVRSMYKRLTLMEKELELQRNNLQAMRQFYSDVQVSYQGGQALKNHVQRARIEMLRAESDYLRVENERDIAKARFNLLLGRKRNVPFRIENVLQEEQLSLVLEQLLATAADNRPDMKIEKALLDSANKELTRQQLRRLPAVAIGFEMMDEEFEEDYAVLLEMSIPVWGWNRGNIRKAKAEQEARQIALNAKEDEIDFEVYAAYMNARLVSDQLEIYKQSLAEATEMLRLAGLRYGEGHIDFLNYLDRLKASQDTRMLYYQGLYRLSTSISELERAVYSSLREEDYLR